MTDQNYNWYRNITLHEHEGFEFVRTLDLASFCFRAGRRLFRASEILRHTHAPPAYPKVDLYHLWRIVSLGSTPWIVSTSTGLPFGWPKRMYRFGLERMASESCRRIIVTSEYAKQWQERKVADYPDLMPRIMPKVELLPPPQPLHVNSIEEKEALLPEELTLTLVGKAFFRKGGLEVLRVVDRLLREGAPLRLNVVSDLSIDDQGIGNVKSQEEARVLIARHPQITHTPNLPNAEVIELFKRSHVGLLPSYVETYGYTVLEAQACGCPTITTNVFAFPEINTSDAGWQIDVEREGPYDYKTIEGMGRIAHAIEQELELILRTLLDDDAQISRRASGALARIGRQHHPGAHAERLRKLYRQMVDATETC